MMFRIFFVLLCLFTLQLTAQDTSRAVIITGQKTPKDSIATQHINSARLFPFQQGSVQQVLELISNVVVKNYGIGSLSTISIRGSSAAQTQVYWEGLNINNAMTGLTDFSLIPTMLFDQIDIHYGNNPTSAALSGSITLEQQGPRFQKRASVKAMLGAESFGNLSGGFNLHTSSKRLSNHCRLTVNRSENKYRYINEDQQAWVNISNASSRQFNFLNDLYLKLNPKHMLSWHLWLTQQQREIPPARNEAVSEKQEDHQNLRSILRWDYHPSSKRSASATAGILFDQYHYADPMVKLNNRAAVLSVPVQYQLNYKPNSHQHIQVMVNANHAQLLQQQDATLQRAGVSVLYANDSVLKRIRIKASLQREITNLFVLPWTGLIRVESKLLPALTGSITFSKRARVPTLNELYFDPGGNMRLKPEVSRNVEGSLRYRAQRATQQLDAEVSVYGRQVNNWIAWYGSSILTPQNIMQVFSRGAEWNIQYVYLLGESKTAESGRTNKSAKSAIHTGLLYAYTIATTTKSAIVNDFSVDKQIPYVPRYQVKANIGFTYHQFECSYIHTYTGYRFITTDESAYLLPYQTSNIVCTAKLPTQKIGCDFSIRLQNLLSARYESIAGRVMPGRNAAIGFRFYEMP